MSQYSKGQRTLVAAGAALLLFGSLVLAMVPAAADDPVSGSTTSTSTSTTTGPAAGGSTPAAETPSVRTTTTTTTTTTLPAGPPVPGGIVPCASLPAGVPSTVDDTCAEMPCPTGRNCGVVVAAPTAGLGPGQYVYLQFYDFVPGDTGVTVYYCANPGGASTLAGIPTCANTDTDSYAEADQPVRIYPTSSSTVVPEGTSSASMQVAEVSAPSDAIAGQQYNPTVSEPGFYCDGTVANACSIDITDASITPGHAGTTAANSVVFPVSFVSGSTGCSNPTIVSSESEFGIELLMPEAARLSCAKDPSTGTVPLDTAVNGLTAVQDLVAGMTQIAFTEDPEAPDQQSLLKSGNYAVIPVALTANVVSFFSQLNFEGNFTLDQMDLTPTMAAGLLTDARNYNGAASTDDKVPCSGPSAGTIDTTGPCLFGPGPCFAGPTCSLYSQLNYINGYNQFTTFQSVQRSDTTGATDQLFNWLCNAPTVPLSFGVHPTESQTAASELELGLSPVSGPGLTTCPETDQVPSIAGQQQLITVNDPSQQALKANHSVFQSGATYATAAFADMNWGESRYYGMNVALLQNAAGAFVAPTTASLDAALADATANPDGSYTPRNLASDPAAYPMPSVIYAVVPTAPMAPTDAAAVTGLLTQLLDLTGGNDTANLPQGFVPLPAPLAATATADVAKDITSVTPVPTPTTTTTVPAGSDTPGSSDFSDGGDGSGLADQGSLIPPAGVIGTMTNLITAAAGYAAGGATTILHHVAAPLLGPALPGYALVASHGRVLVPEAMGLGIAAVLIGAVLMGSGMVRRRRARLSGAVGPDPEEEPV